MIRLFARASHFRPLPVNVNKRSVWFVSSKCQTSQEAIVKLSVQLHLIRFNHISCSRLELSSSSYSLIGNQSSTRHYSKESSKTVTPERLSEEIEQLQAQIKELKKRQKQPEKALNSSDAIQIEITDRQIGDSDEEQNVYRLAYDFPGFKSKNIRVTIEDNILKIYAFQTSGKRSDANKNESSKPAEYIYEHTNEEILPDEVQADQVSASFDAENGFLVIEAILPDEVLVKQVLAETRKRNELLGKAQEQIEKKQKQLLTLTRPADASTTTESSASTPNKSD